MLEQERRAKEDLEGIYDELKEQGRSEERKIDNDGVRRRNVIKSDGVNYENIMSDCTNETLRERKGGRMKE